MKVILLADVKKLGKKDQTIEVSDGYAVNFLFPRKLAVQVTKKSVEVLENQQEERKENEAKAKAEAQELAKRLDEITLPFKVKTGREGKLFGAISLKQVTDELEKLSIKENSLIKDHLMSLVIGTSKWNYIKALSPKFMCI